MPEEGQVGTTTSGPEGGTPTGKETELKSVQPDAAKLQAELEEVRDALKRANAEAAERRIKLKEFEEAEETRKKAAMSESEKAQSELSELRTQYDTVVAEYDSLRLRQAFYDAVGAAEMVFTSDQARRDAYELADLAAAIDGGEIKNDAIKKSLKALQESRPYLFGKPAVPSDDAARRSEKPPPEAPTEEDVKEFAARLGVNPDFVDPKLLIRQ